ncbi:MAG: cupin domain-containing protein [Myxococcota bacterium]|nr:cupin domain-containing protein [Myxococcota bacterium]
MRRLKQVSAGMGLYLMMSIAWHAWCPENTTPGFGLLAAGDVVENRRLGERVVYQRLPTTPQGTASIEVTLRPNAAVPVAHIHPSMTEVFHVVHGQLELWIQGEQHALRPGQSFVVAPGMPHAFRNASNGTTRFEVTLEPAGHMPLAIRELHRYLSQPPSHPVAHFLQMIRFAEAFDVYMAGVPVWIQRLGVFCVAPTARLLGFRPSIVHSRPNLQAPPNESIRD